VRGLVLLPWTVQLGMYDVNRMDSQGSLLESKLPPQYFSCAVVVWVFGYSQDAWPLTILAAYGNRNHGDRELDHCLSLSDSIQRG
jgi:hypothetical protein